MCRPITEADSSAQTVSGIIWAMPVNIAQLGAHLQAYDETNVVTIRSCHSFGQGDDVHINKLPLEILERIIEEVQFSARVTAFESWNHHFLCFQKRCCSEDHLRNLDPEEFKATKWQYRQFPDLDSCDPAGYKSLRLAWYPSSREEAGPRCIAQRDQWASFICQCPVTHESTKAGAFVKYDEILKSEFGLEALIFSHEIDRKLNMGGHVASSTRYHTTTCYLILPARLSRDIIRHREHTPESPECAQGLFNQRWGDTISNTLSSSVIDPSSLSITAEQRSRFGKVRRLLGLKPYVPSAQLNDALSAYCPAESNSGIGFRPKLDIEPYLGWKMNEWAEKLAARREAIEAHNKMIENLTWPQLISFAKSDFYSRGSWHGASSLGSPRFPDSEPSCGDRPEGHSIE
ncbi:hypothetical protein BU16DRAFT_559584 [Lophium mytilinum]|uniref:Uncharacterized protein n=1 Tax=Lophium mytilinum TaxID=390894 RepID=A0A6A6QZE7_9PEZI|nr:hypothetical protein BU16DRAFT_559584 [Lophium mytilinum]